MTHHHRHPFAPALRRRLLALHHDTRGAISVLVLLMIWCLVAILGLAWNTTEESVARAKIQSAADAAAHGAATWMARAINTIDAQNMIICQDASEEVIWLAVPPTDAGLRAKLQGELARIQQMKAQQGLQQLLDQIRSAITTIATERQMTIDALAIVKAAPVDGNYADTNEFLRYQNLYRQSESAREWVWNTYVMGLPAPPGAPGSTPRPGPPGPNAEGLATLVSEWPTVQNQNEILDYITGYINATEMPFVLAFESRTAPATSLPIDVMMARHEEEVYQNQLAILRELPLAIEAQRAAFADLYKTDITLATLKNSSHGPALVSVPLIPAADVPPIAGYTDSIRTAFPEQAAAANLSPVITIDPINVHVNEAIIWHPDIGAAVPPALRTQFPSLAESYRMNANFPGGWGHIWTMPLEQYVHQRVNNDLQTIANDYMRALDQTRTGPLATTIRQMMHLPNNGILNIAGLPNTLPDDQPMPNIPPLAPGDPVPPVRFDSIYILPQLIVPANASDLLRAQIGLYNRHAGSFTGAVNSLRGYLISYTAFFNAFTTAFAGRLWETNVNVNCVNVLERLGMDKHFVVLSSYGLRPIPEWAKPGMYENVLATIESHILLVSIRPVINAIMADLRQNDPNGLGRGFLDVQHRNNALQNGYIGQATQIADQIVRPAAHQIALSLAAEWINRPWPYEITPPSQPVPPFRGISPADRMRDYSVIAAARQTDATAPRLLLTSYFGSDQNKIVAYGQGETFNWMEFNDNYGGNERYDVAVDIPEVTYLLGNFARFTNFVGSPRGWRVCTVGGWNWRARLSLADALYDALPLNDELRAYLQDAGISDPSRGALDEINLH